MSEEVKLAIGDAAELARLRSEITELRKRAETAEALVEQYARQRQADAKAVFEQFDRQQARLDAAHLRIGFLEALAAGLRKAGVHAVHKIEQTLSGQYPGGEALQSVLTVMRAALAEGAGAAVEAELAAARAVVEQARSYAFDPRRDEDLIAALAAYDAAVKGRADAQ